MSASVLWASASEVRILLRFVCHFIAIIMVSVKDSSRIGKKERVAYYKTAVMTRGNLELLVTTASLPFVTNLEANDTTIP